MFELSPKRRLVSLPATSGLPLNGHRQTGLVGPVRANKRHRAFA
jgi:hypothetical protein